MFLYSSARKHKAVTAEKKRVGKGRAARRLRHLCCFALFFLLCVAKGFAQDSLNLEIHGGSKTLKTNVRRHLNIDELRCDISELHLRNALKNADKSISAALRALGYYRGQWTIARTWLAANNGNKSTGGCWRVDVHITPGEPATFTEVRIDIVGAGSADPAFTEILNTVPLKQGQQVNHGRYERSKKVIRQRATNLGYFSGAFTEHRLAVDRETNTASAILIFASGERYKFGDIHYAPVALNLEFLHRYQTFASGDPYDASQLILFQSNLINSQYFDRVSVNQSDPDPATGAVDIEVDLVVKSRFESTFGAGYSTDIGPKVSYVLKNRRFGKDGDTYQLSSQWSPVQKNAGIQFQQPGADPVREKTLWSLGWQSEDTDTTDSSSYLAEVSQVRLLDNGWVFTRSLSLLHENYDIGDDASSSILFYPGINIARSRANDTSYPTRGWRLSSGLHGAVEDLLSDTSFVQGTVDAKIIAPLFGGRFIGRSGLGATHVEDFSALPTSLRFFAGGDNSVRGFDFRTLGPRNDEGDVVGGKHLITASIEYDYPVYKDYSAAVFFDTGTAFDTSDFTLYESVGLGARWHSPIGPIRVDFAFPLKDGGFRLHLSMGPDL